MKYHLRRLPYQGYESYDDSSKDLAFVIPLYDAVWYNPDQEGIIDEAYIRGAIAVGKSLTLNTDIVQRKIPIFYFLEDCVANGRLHLFRDSGIRDDRILGFNTPESGMIKKFRVSKTFYMLSDPVLQEYGIVLKWDADLFACCDPALDKKFDTGFLQGDDLGVLYFDKNSVTDIREKQHWWDKWDGTRDTFDHNYGISKSIIESVNPEIKLSKDMALSNMLCGVMRFPRLLPDGFKEFVLKLEPLLGDEELIMSLWVEKTGQDIKSLGINDIAWRPENVIEQRKKGGYWSHVGGSLPEQEKWETDWHKDIGVTTFKPKPKSDIDLTVAVLNLAKRKDRKDAFIKHLRATGYDGHIATIKGIDRTLYNNNRDLSLAAIGEYPNFNKIFWWDDTEHTFGAHTWAYLRCLKWISLQSDYVLMMEDDMALGCSWDKLKELVGQLPDGFMLAMLNYNHDESLQKDIPRFNEAWLSGTKCNGTTANIFSPEGADIIHKIAANDPGTTPEMHIKALDMDNLYSASPVLGITHPEAGRSDLTPVHNK